LIELFASDTPNGKKISIMLEEIGFPYKVIPVDLNNGDQFKKEFIKISPFSKIPVIKDNENEKSVFGSGAILIYLAEKSKKFYDEDNKINIDQWLMAQMGLVGPLIGQYHSFYRFNKGKSKYGEERYYKITKDLYKNLNNRLSQSLYLSGEKYTIADIATWPWIARHQWHDIGLKNYDHLSTWYKVISERDAVKKGYNFMGAGEIPKP
jgi:GST-like protein|tara:strand:- start:1394 stop:2017 length:624 start_codon:yes stop_codon:yes gene_type:complete